MASNNENRVGFSVVDVEMGRESDETSRDVSSKSTSREFSVVGPLPSETLQETAPKRRYSNSSDASIQSGGSFNKKFSFNKPSILKKRSNRSVKGDTTAKTGVTGFTGSVRTSSTGGSSSSGHSQGQKRTPRYVWYSRWMFLTLLCMVASSLGYLTYTVLTNNEAYLATCLFGRVAEYAIDSIGQNQKRKKLGMDSMGSVLGKLACSSYDLISTLC